MIYIWYIYMIYIYIYDIYMIYIWYIWYIYIVIYLYDHYIYIHTIFIPQFTCMMWIWLLCKSLDHQASSKASRSWVPFPLWVLKNDPLKSQSWWCDVCVPIVSVSMCIISCILKYLLVNISIGADVWNISEWQTKSLWVCQNFEAPKGQISPIPTVQTRVLTNPY